MFWILAGLILGSGIAPEVEGRIVSLYGRGFSFQVLEPSGWVLDTRAAPQIANFVFHPAGVNWRQANSIVVARFVARETDSGLAAFLEQNSSEFMQACPFGEVASLANFLETSGGFEVTSFHCPGVRKELVAAGPFPGYFVVFALSSSEASGVEDATPAFRAILESFHWFSLPGEGKPAPARREPGSNPPDAQSPG